MSFLLFLGLTSVHWTGYAAHLVAGHWGIIIPPPAGIGHTHAATHGRAFLPIAVFRHALSLSGHDKGERLAQRGGDWRRPLSPRFRRSYLTLNGFYIRAVIYFAVLAAADVHLQRFVEAAERQAGRPRLRLRFKMLAGPGIILYVFVMSFAAIDWVMSLSPHWASTIYGSFSSRDSLSPRWPS